MSYAKKSIIILAVAAFLFLLVYPFSFLPGFLNPPFRLGLDLLGGTHLVYKADLAVPVPTLPTVETESRGTDAQRVAVQHRDRDDEAMEGVRDVIERRVNAFGVSEPLVQVEGKDRLVVELAGIKDISEAIRKIGETPFLQFKEERPKAGRQAILDAQGKGERLTEDPYFVDTALTGKYLTRAQVAFGDGVGAQVSLQFNGEGARIFEELTKKNLGKPLAIYLDGQPISIPIVQTEIADGSAVISGNFTVKQAKELATRLNAGALPVPITLISQQSIGASLGHDSLAKSLKAGIFGLIAVAVFMLLFYRLSGLASVLALIIYTVVVLAIYKLIPITLTLAGIAGFILSLGMAVDANVLIFARMREELKEGKSLNSAFQEGFRRAWLSIRDSHVTTLLGALVLYLFTTSIVKGFALTLGIGVLMSLFSAITVTRSFLGTVIGPKLEGKRWLF